MRDAGLDAALSVCQCQCQWRVRHCGGWELHGANGDRRGARTVTKSKGREGEAPREASKCELARPSEYVLWGM